jgi:hypothetical protein
MRRLEAPEVAGVSATPRENQKCMLSGAHPYISFFFALFVFCPGGGRGGARGGRAAAAAAVGEDHSQRQFDRRGAPTKHAPRHAHKDGAALGPEGGAAAAVVQGESVAEAVAVEGTEAAVEEAVPDMVSDRA